MACSTCRRTTCSGCSSSCNNCSTQTTYLTTCSGCSETINTDCVIYNGDVLPFESITVTNGSTRTLSDLLALLGNGSGDRESKLIKFNSDGTTDDGTAYTLVAEDTTKILLITQGGSGETDPITNTITLPNTADFINKEIIIKNISTQYDPSGTTVSIVFNQAVQYEWNPAVVSSTAFTDLESAHFVVRLRLIKTSELSYQWIVVD